MGPDHVGQSAGIALGPLLDAVSDLVFLARRVGPDDYQLIDVNRAYLEVAGAPKAAVVGRHVEELLPPEGAEYVKARYREALDGRAPISYEEDVRLPAGRHVFQVLLTPILDVPGGPYLLGAGRDITRQRLAEEALHERGERLLQARKLEAVGQLAAGVAHDFNNLLTAIRGYSDLLLADMAEHDRGRSDVEAIAAAADRATALTRQLLAFSRQRILQPRNVDLGHLVRGLESMLRRLVPENIDIRVLLDEDLAATLVDPAELEQVILNLALNARDAMPEGGVLIIETVNVELDAAYAEGHADVAPGHYVMLAVSDTGTGMDTETKSRIFEPFFTTKPRGQGTGLGLSTAYGIVRQAGGTIWVYSEPREGTTFKVYLPRAAGAAAPIEPPLPLVDVRGGSETVLVVEDDESVRGLTRKLLRRHGYAVLEAADATEAIAVSRAHSGAIALLLTDVILPGMSGKALSDRLARERPELRALYVSGYTENTIVHHGVLDADVAFLEKPFRPDALVQRVREVIDSRS